MLSKKSIYFGGCMLFSLISSIVMATEISLPLNGQMILQSLIETKTTAIPQTYRHMNVLYRGVTTGSIAYDTLQQAITIGLIPNTSQRINLERPLTVKSAQRLLRILFNTPISFSHTGRLYQSDIPELLTLLGGTTASKQPLSNISIDITETELIDVFHDAYKKLRTDFIDSDHLTDKQLIQGAIKGMVESTEDPYTNYFSQSESKDFSDTLQGEFFGIGVHVEMKEPGKLFIIAPIPGSPGDKAGLLAGDQIVKIDDVVVDHTLSLSKAVSKIKGPDNTIVQLMILRNNKEMSIAVTRGKIVVTPLSLKELSSDKALVSISMFQFGLDKLFDKTIATVVEKGYDTLVIDLRDNPGGSLEDVEHMLDYFVPQGKPAVIVKSNKSEYPSVSLGVATGSSLQHKKLIILINKGSASASEIMAGVIKEYGSNVTLVGEKSFGKGSVQTIWEYADGSSIKITVAKRLMGKTRTSIDKVGITPDVTIVDDPNTLQDEVIEYAKKI